jgi:hypothetical protein
MNDFPAAIHQLLEAMPEVTVHLDSSMKPKQIMERLAHRVIELAKAGQTESFARIFEVVESQVIYGSQETQELMIVGFLENIKNIASLENMDYSVFESLLGSETHVAWRWLEKRWQGKRSLADSLRSKNRPAED